MLVLLIWQFYADFVTQSAFMSLHTNIFVHMTLTENSIFFESTNIRRHANIYLFLKQGKRYAIFIDREGHAIHKSSPPASCSTEGGITRSTTFFSLGRHCQVQDFESKRNPGQVYQDNLQPR